MVWALFITASSVAVVVLGAATERPAHATFRNGKFGYKMSTTNHPESRIGPKISPTQSPRYLLDNAIESNFGKKSKLRVEQTVAPESEEAFEEIDQRYFLQIGVMTPSTVSSDDYDLLYSGLGSSQILNADLNADLDTAGSSQKFLADDQFALSEWGLNDETMSSSSGFDCDDSGNLSPRSILSYCSKEAVEVSGGLVPCNDDPGDCSNCDISPKVPLADFSDASTETTSRDHAASCSFDLAPLLDCTKLSIVESVRDNCNPSPSNINTQSVHHDGRTERGLCLTKRCGSCSEPESVTSSEHVNGKTNDVLPKHASQLNPESASFSRLRSDAIAAVSHRVGIMDYSAKNPIVLLTPRIFLSATKFCFLQSSGVLHTLSKNRFLCLVFETLYKHSSQKSSNQVSRNTFEDFIRRVCRHIGIFAGSDLLLRLRVYLALKEIAWKAILIEQNASRFHNLDPLFMQFSVNVDSSVSKLIHRKSSDVAGEALTIAAGSEVETSRAMEEKDHALLEENSTEQRRAVLLAITPPMDEGDVVVHASELHSSREQLTTGSSISYSSESLLALFSIAILCVIGIALKPKIYARKRASSWVVERVV